VVHLVARSGCLMISTCGTSSPSSCRNYVLSLPLGPGAGLRPSEHGVPAGGRPGHARCAFRTWATHRRARSEEWNVVAMPHARGVPRVAVVGLVQCHSPWPNSRTCLPHTRVSPPPGVYQPARDETTRSAPLNANTPRSSASQGARWSHAELHEILVCGIIPI
jgi:hypothetical protein